MPKSAPPIIAVPVSPDTQWLILLGQIKGARVQVWGDGAGNSQLAQQVVVDDVAQYPNEMFLVKRALVAQEELRALQIVDMDPGPETPQVERVIVMNAATTANDLSPLGQVSHLWVCGEALLLDGGYPGAQVQVYANKKPIGLSAAVTPGGDAYFFTSRPLLGGDVDLTAVQFLKNSVQGPASSLAVPESVPLGPDDRPRPPTLVGPVYDCQRYVAIDDVYEGAWAGIWQGSPPGKSPTDSGYFYVPGQWLLVDPPLSAGAKVAAGQVFSPCKLRSLLSEPPETVRDEDPPPPVIGFVCSGATTLSVGNLVPGAQVWLFGDDNQGPTDHQSLVDRKGEPDLVASAWKDVCDFQVPAGAFKGAKKLRAVQVLCDNPMRVSRYSDWRTITSPPTSAVPVVHEPVVHCGVVVRVENVFPLAYVYIFSKKHGTKVGAAFVPTGADHADVPLWIPLSAGDTITAGIVFCAQKVENPNGAGVSAFPGMATPILDQAISDCGPVVVRQLVPGARVDVYVNAVFLCTYRSPLDTLVIDDLPTSATKPGTVISCRQQICGMFSNFGSGTVVAGKLAVVGGDRVCELTGEVDTAWAWGFQADARPHATATKTLFHVAGTDLGHPIEHGGRLYFFFGDTDWDNDTSDLARGADSIAFTTALSAEPCPPLTFVTTSSNGMSGQFRVKGIDPRALGLGQTPQGGFEYAGRVFMTFIVDPRYASPGRYLASAADPEDEFDLELKVDSVSSNPLDMRFIESSVTVVRNADWPYGTFPASTGDALLWFGSNTLDVYLAWVPLSSAPPHVPKPADPNDPTSWNNAPWWYFTGKTANGTPVWTQDRRLAMGIWELWAPQVDRNAAKFSVNWVPSIRRWLLLWGDPFGWTELHKYEVSATSALVAREPWGPWESLGPGDGFSGTAPNLFDASSFAWANSPGYAALLIPRFTRYDPQKRVTTVYYLVSFNWQLHGYQGIRSYGVHLMKANLKCV